MIHPQFNDSSPAQTSDGSSVITTKIVEIEPLVYFKLLTMFIGVSMGKLLAIYMLILAHTRPSSRIFVDFNLITISQDIFTYKRIGIERNFTKS